MTGRREGQIVRELDRRKDRGDGVAREWKRGEGRWEGESGTVSHARQKILDSPGAIADRFRCVSREIAGFLLARHRRRALKTPVDGTRAISCFARGDESRRAGATDNNRHAHSHVLPRSEGCGRRFLPDPYSSYAQTSPPRATLRCALREGGGLWYCAREHRVGGSEIQSRPLPPIRKFCNFSRSPGEAFSFSPLAFPAFFYTFPYFYIFAPAHHATPTTAFSKSKYILLDPFLSSTSMPIEIE